MPIDLVIADSITKLPRSGCGAVLVVGSHGGAYAAGIAAAANPRGIVLNDAGIGMDDAGIAGLSWLNAIGCPACTVSADSARIGWGSDMIERGVLSRVNDVAARLGCRPGQTCREAVALLATAPQWSGSCPSLTESRFVLREEPVRVVALDSNSLVRPNDADTIVITGSHGGLLGGRPETAISSPTAGAIYHDAGGGLDGAGMSRLPALDALGVPAATVAGTTARIGDARSVWLTGRLSAVNVLARRNGISVGQSCQDFVHAIALSRALKTRLRK